MLLSPNGAERSLFRPCIKESSLIMQPEICADSLHLARPSGGQMAPASLFRFVAPEASALTCIRAPRSPRRAECASEHCRDLKVHAPGP